VYIRIGIDKGAYESGERVSADGGSDGLSVPIVARSSVDSIRPVFG